MGQTEAHSCTLGRPLLWLVRQDLMEIMSEKNDLNTCIFLPPQPVGVFLHDCVGGSWVYFHLVFLCFIYKLIWGFEVHLVLT